MERPSTGSVTTWLEALKAHQEHAAQELWNRYFTMLLSVARRHMGGIARDTDEEDVALSAMKSAMIGVQNNRFPDVTDRTGLWPLLVTITARKAMNEHKRQRTKKRDRTAERPIMDEQMLAGSEPTPDFAVSMTETIQALFRALDDQTLQTIAQWKLEGYSNDEIAKKLNVSTRTVVRKLARIRQEWDEAT
jgi:RNA polymerase sigma factor (sigma-70 family)